MKRLNAVTLGLMLGLFALVCVWSGLFAIFHTPYESTSAYNGILSIACGGGAWYINRFRKARKPKHEA